MRRLLPQRRRKAPQNQSNDPGLGTEHNKCVRSVNLQFDALFAFLFIN